MELITTKFRFVENLWDEAHANSLDGLGKLVYRSNLLGADWRITNTGGGNTSSKLIETDPMTGDEVEVLWVKGSGGDLRTAGRGNFASLYQQKLIELQEIYAAIPERGPKTPAEDAMVGMFTHCTFNLNPRAPSIDTPLHSFVPHPYVDHTHPAACIAIATASNGRELTREIYGDEVGWVDWQRPGFELGLELQRMCRENPQYHGIIMGGHGLINWAESDRECYLLTLSLIERAAAYLEEHGASTYDFGGARHEALPEEERSSVLVKLLPWLRGKVSQEMRFIGTVQTSDDVLAFVNGADAHRLAELGTSCPDHFLRTKIKPLFVDWSPKSEGVAELKEKLESGLDAYQADYAAYYEAHRHPNSPEMRVSSPTVVLIPGVGMIAWGKTKSESRVTAEFYRAAIEVMRGAEAVSRYTALPRQEAFDIEYWLLEEAKLKRMPPEAELSRRIVAVVGAGSGIGREVVGRLLREGATVAAIDLNAGAAEETAQSELKSVGMGIGVAGTGISGSGDVIGLGADITDRASVREALAQTIIAYGGLDHVVITSGLYVSPDVNGRIDDDDWGRTFAVNVTGPSIVADEAATVWRAQNLRGSLVITTSVNAAVAKRGSLAYDTSKSAANHLVRELAIELAPLVRVNGVAPATVVEGSSMFPRDRVIASLAKYDLPHDDEEGTEALRSRLAEFYAGRTLTRQPITPADQAEAIFLLVGERLGKTTGQSHQRRRRPDRGVSAMKRDADIVIIGAGIVGLATAHNASERYPGRKVVVLEKEDGIARHQTGNNSGVLHSGIYYKPGSLKAINCREGKLALEEFCRREGIPFENCGKVIVATSEEERPLLKGILERGKANGVRCEVIGRERLLELEPHVNGIEAIHVPEAGSSTIRPFHADWPTSS
jgi:rhamnulose-1-phosphate aldolase/alcohol dehydrogenase